MSTDCYPSVRSFLVNVNRREEERRREAKRREEKREKRLFGSLADGQGKKTIGTDDRSFFFSRSSHNHQSDETTDHRHLIDCLSPR